MHLRRMNPNSRPLTIPRLHLLRQREILILKIVAAFHYSLTVIN
ncbi:hypothetical protein BH10PLA2_BH10PLA2_07350 [soil metagenome]